MSSSPSSSSSRDLSPGLARGRLERFRGWLVAAALYNACWGAAVAAGAGSVAWKAIGMLVLAYAPGYWWAARDPERRAHFVAVGLLGKVLGRSASPGPRRPAGSRRGSGSSS